MDNKFSTIKERCLKLAELKGFNKENFCEKIGMTYGNFKGSAKKTPLNSNAIANVLTLFPDVNLKWLILGEGNILSGESPQSDGLTVVYAENPDKNDLIALQREKIKSLESEIKELKRGSTAGFVASEDLDLDAETLPNVTHKSS